MKSRSKATTGLALVLLLVCTVSNARADSAAEMLEKGIYAEETLGKLDEAIKIYRQVLANAAETEKVGANAQFRLAQCLVKQQKTTEAKAAFELLIKNYPNQRDLVIKASEFLSTAMDLTPPPWKSGERSTLTMRLGGGRAIGIIGLAIDKAEGEGKAAWNMTIRRFVAELQNEGVSRVSIDENSRPIRTEFEHVLLGNTNADWTSDKIEITTRNGTDDKTTTVELDQAAYANDQWFFCFRQLPLAIGYKATIPLRIAFTGGNAVGLEVEVSKKEKVETPVGTFDCFRIDTNIQQTFWIADVPERYIVRFKGGGVDALVTSITNGGEAQTIKNEELGFQFEVPGDWFYHSLVDPNEKGESLYRLVSLDMASVVLSVKDKSKLNDDYRDSLKAWAQSKLEKGKRNYDNFELREPGMADSTCAGVPAISMTIDQALEKSKVVRNVVLALTKERSIAIASTVRADLYEGASQAIDQIRKSITVE